MAFGGWELLPDDLTAEVLRCLPPRSLAVSRSVCRGWRDLVDARRLLRADLLPRSVGGIFMNYCMLYTTEFLARPTTGRRPSISGDLDFVPDGFPEVLDHCNGLLLCTDDPDDLDSDFHDYVANPATRRWARLPRRPTLTLLGKGKSKSERKEKEAFLRQTQIKWLVYDPTVSPHYEVFLIHSLQDRHEQSGLLLPSCPLQIQVYSSVTGHWEDRLFLPEARVVHTIALSDRGSKVYWRGALYLLCENEEKMDHRRRLFSYDLFCENDDFILRVSISDATYRLIPVPADVGFSRSRESLPVPANVGFSGCYNNLCYGTLSLGISENGVYCASEYGCGLRIVLLNESSSCGQTLWELKHSVDLTSFLRKLHALEDHSGDHQENGPWMLQDINYYKYEYGNDKPRELAEDRFEWNSDDDNVLNTEDMVEGNYIGHMDVLGFHPYKEIVFLNADVSRAVAYHWNTSKFQDLGNICPNNYHEIAEYRFVQIDTSFIYTPCWMDGGFPEEEKKSISVN